MLIFLQSPPHIISKNVLKIGMASCVEWKREKESRRAEILSNELDVSGDHSKD